MKIERGQEPEGKFLTYRDYKPHLKPLFRHRCAYCQMPDFRNGGLDGMTVDHFQPQERYGPEGPGPDLSKVWSNLYYCCSPCNSKYKKSHPTADEEAAGKRLIDPCNEDPDGHLRLVVEKRSGDFCRVRASTRVGMFTAKVLKLNYRDALRDFWREIHAKERRAKEELAACSKTLAAAKREERRRGPSGDLQVIIAETQLRRAKVVERLREILSHRPFLTLTVR